MACTSFRSTAPRHDVELVGGKNSSLGEMLRELGGLGVRVPDGYATTVDAYREFLRQGGLRRAIDERARAPRRGGPCGTRANRRAKSGRWMLETPLPARLRDEVLAAWRALDGGRGIAVAVRSSATAEDLPEASFAGQQETFLNVRGEHALLHAMHEVFASLFNDRAIAYRVHQGFDHSLVALVGRRAAHGAQRPRRERRDVHARYRLGLPRRRVHHELVRSRRDRRAGRRESGRVLRLQARAARRHARGVAPQPRREGHQDGLRRAGASRSASSTVDVPAEERAALLAHRRRESRSSRARPSRSSEHYGCPMDIEWAKDGGNGRDVHRAGAARDRAEPLGPQPAALHAASRARACSREGRSIGQKIGAGRARIVRGVHEMERVQPGDVLVADMTDPDWEPVMKRAAAIVTQPRRPHLPRRDHRARARRARGRRLRRRDDDDSATAQAVTVSCAEGDTGYVYEGALAFERAGDRARRAAAAARANHDERRQPGPRVRVSPACRTTA